MNNQAKHNLKSILIFFSIVLLIYFSIFVLAVTITQIQPTGNITTSNSSVIIEYNISVEDYLNNLTFNWDNTNYSICDNSLVLFMNFDNRSALGENDTEVKDLSKYGNNGTVVGGSNISWTPNGKYGGAFNFSGNTHSVQIVNPIKTNVSELSLSVWINSYDCNGTERIISSGDIGGGTGTRGYEIKIDTSQRIVLLINNMTLTGNANRRDVLLNCNKGIWSHIAFTFNSSIFKIYKNGVLEISTITTFNNLNLSGLNIDIGRRYASNSQFFNGSLDDLLIYNKTLSDNDILEVYYSSLTKYDSQNWTFYSNHDTPFNLTNYFICSSNSTNEVCSDTKSIQSSVVTLTANFSTSLGIISNNFYGINEHGIYLTNGTKIDSNGDGTLETDLNYTWNREQFQNSKMGSIRIDSFFQTTIHPQQYKIDTVKWAYENNKKVLVILEGMNGDYDNTTSGWCLSPYTSCSPENLTLWNEEQVTYINELTTNGLYNSSIEIECMNEPSGSWLNNLSSDNSLKWTEYVNFCNSSMNALRNVYPDMPFYFGGGYTREEQQLLYKTVISNLSNIFDNKTGLSFHIYSQPHGYGTEQDFKYLSNAINNSITQIQQWCDTYGASCSKFALTEVNVGERTDTSLNRGIIIKNSTSSNKEYGMQIATMYSYGLTMPENLTIYPYQWSEKYLANDTTNYPEHPQIWAWVTQPELLVDGQEQFKSPYNVTKSFAHLCPAGSTVYTSSSDDSTIKTVTCKKGSQRSLIVINTDTVSKNVTTNITGSNIVTLKNYLTGTSISTTNNISQLGIIMLLIVAISMIFIFRKLKKRRKKS